jgi:hypothetical protein
MERPGGFQVEPTMVSRIERVESSVYEVVLQQNVGVAPAVFTFRVDAAHGIDVVSWTPDFAQYMQNNLSPAKLLFDAILSFHRAQNAEFPVLSERSPS